MRTLANRADIAAAEGHWCFTYLEVTADDGSWLNLGALTVGAEDLDFFNTFQLAESIDSNTLSFSASLKRDIGPNSLSPFRTDSPINLSQVSPGLYAPALDLNRLWRVMISVGARGTTPVMPDDYFELNSGVIESLVIRGLADTVDVEGMGMESPILKAFVLKDRTYSGDMEDVIQEALDDQFGTDVIPLLGYATGEHVDDTIGDINLMPALSDIAAIKGDTLRYRYDSSHVNQFTLFTPPRAGGTPDWSIDGLEYEDLDVEINLSGVRNLIPVTYYDAASAAVATVVAPGAEVGTLASVAGVGTFSSSQAGIIAVGAKLVIDRTGDGDFVAYEVLTFDGTTGVTLLGDPTFTARDFYTSASITKYGLQVFAMDLSADTQVTTQAGAQGLADFVLADREDPAMVQRLKAPGLWFVQLHDIVGTAANGVHYDEDQSGGVTAYTLSGANGMLEATIDLAGYPKGRYTTWKQIGSGAPASRLLPVVTSATMTAYYVDIGGGVRAAVVDFVANHNALTKGLYFELFDDIALTSLVNNYGNTADPSGSTKASDGFSIPQAGITYYMRVTPYSGVPPIPFDRPDGVAGVPVVENRFVPELPTDSTTIVIDLTSVPGEMTAHIAPSAPLPGSPTTTTQSPGDNSTKVSTTAFVTAALASGGGITQLTGNVTAGPGSGSQVATIPNDTVTYAKMQNVSATSRILGRKTAGAGDVEELTLSEVLDFISSAAQGDLLYRGASSWARLPAGVAGQLLQTAGAAANPAWVSVSGAGAVGGIYESTPTKPLAASFTLDNAGTASMADGVFGIVLTMPSSAFNVRFIRYTAGIPGASWTLIMRGSMVTPFLSASIHHNAVLIRNSANGRIINFAHNNAVVLVQRFSSYNAFNANIRADAASYGMSPGWKKVTSDGTTLSFYTSSNGSDWGLIAQEAIATYLGALDQVGIGSVNTSGSGVTNIDVFESFTLV